MIVCKQCGVELDDEMQICPLCNTSVQDGETIESDIGKRSSADGRAKPTLLMRTLWQIVSVLLLSAIVATLIINLSIVGYITWSIYPVTICLVIFSYASLIALWQARFVIQLFTGWIASSALLIGIGTLSGEDWVTALALPVLFAANLILMLLVLILSNLKVKGLNILAIMFVAIAILCLIIEGILSLYFKGEIVVSWSVIVAACLLPATAGMIFMYFRTRNNRDLQKIFHT